MAKRFQPRNRAQWQQLAARRIVNILRHHKLCNARQLEAKIAEAGPPSMRAQPLSIVDGLQYLLDRGTIKVALAKGSTPGIDTEFYALTDFDTARYTDKGRLDLITEYYPRYVAVSHDNPSCGDVLETLVDAAAQLNPSFVRLGSPGTSFNNYVVDGHRIDNSPPLDHVIYYKNEGVTIGIEDKNWRQWMYPNDEMIPKTLRKCASNGHSPVVITRKLPYITRLLFKACGILGFETHFQFFHPDVEQDLALARHKDGLGFADLRFTSDPPAHLVRFFQVTLPQQILHAKEVFETNRSILSAYGDRQLTYWELIRELAVFGEEEFDETMIDYYEEF